MRRVLSSLIGLSLLCAHPLPAQRRPAARPSPALTSIAPSAYLYLWTASADSTQPDFLAVVDVRATSPNYGAVVTTVPVPGRQNRPHHTEHALAADGTLFANGFGSGQSWIFDLSTPAQPRIRRQFGDIAGMMHPHSFLRLPNGHVLATFQMRHANGATQPGGLAELTPAGDVVRTASAMGPGVDPRSRPYSGAILPAIDRVFTTTTDMAGAGQTNQVQLWRLSDLRLLSTFDLPNGPRGNEGTLTAEPRVLPDGRSLLVSTFSCGLYLVRGLDTATPQATLVASFPEQPPTHCAVPAIVGHYYLVTVPAWRAVVCLDISDPLHPREVSRLTLEADDVPHWLAVEPNGQRVVVTGYAGMQHRVVLAHFDAGTGALTFDRRFAEPGSTVPGIRFDTRTWPHGGTAKGIPHGAVFSR